MIVLKRSCPAVSHWKRRQCQTILATSNFPSLWTVICTLHGKFTFTICIITNLIKHSTRCLWVNKISNVLREGCRRHTCMRVKPNFYSAWRLQAQQTSKSLSSSILRFSPLNPMSFHMTPSQVKINACSCSCLSSYA